MFRVLKVEFWGQGIYSNVTSAMAGGFKNVAHAVEPAAPANYNRTYAGHAKGPAQAHSPARNAKARD